MRPLVLCTPLFAVSLAAQVAPVPPVAPRAPEVSVWAPRAVDVDQLNSLRYKIDAQAYTSLNLDYSPDFGALGDQWSNLNTFASTNLGGYGTTFGGGPVAWAHQDPADSLYRNARDLLNRGDYRKAAALFKALPQQYPSSAYVGDAQYWQAFALYRIGGTPELQEALTVLAAFRRTAAANPPTARAGDRAADRAQAANDAAGSRNVSRGAGSSVGVGSGTAPNGSVRVVTNSYDVSRGTYVYSGSSFGRGASTQTDATALAARIANVLASRGLAGNAEVKEALALGGNSCDQEEQSVRSEALTALVINDPATAQQMATKILSERDDCSIPLRRTAAMMVASRDDAAATTALIAAAKNDPSPGIRMAAMQYLIHRGTPEGRDAVLTLLHTSTDVQIQRSAINALAESNDPKVRTELRALVEDNSAAESLRTAALDDFDRDKLSAEDATWLRNLYAHTTSARLKDRIISLLARSGGDANNQWLAGMIRNDDESLESRTAALMRVGRTMDIAALNRIYDASSQRPIREAVVELLSERKEPEALDKIVDIAKSGTDPSMRRVAIGVLARSKDPRAAKLLLQLVDK